MYTIYVIVIIVNKQNKIDIAANKWVKTPNCFVLKLDSKLYPLSIKSLIDWRIVAYY